MMDRRPIPILECSGGWTRCHTDTSDVRSDRRSFVGESTNSVWPRMGSSIEDDYSLGRIPVCLVTNWELRKKWGQKEGGGRKDILSTENSYRWSFGLINPRKGRLKQGIGRPLSTGVGRGRSHVTPPRQDESTPSGAVVLCRDRRSSVSSVRPRSVARRVRPVSGGDTKEGSRPSWAEPFFPTGDSWCRCGRVPSVSYDRNSERGKKLQGVYKGRDLNNKREEEEKNLPNDMT